LTSAVHLRSGPERATVANIDHARNQAIGALDALNGQASTQAPDYWVGYPASALEDVIYALRAGA